MFKIIKQLFTIITVVSTFYAPYTFSLEFNFATGNNGFVGDFADYPIQQEDFYELSWGWENLPAILVSNTDSNSSILSKGLFLSGNNHSDDLWMYAKRRIEGLVPDTLYSLSFSLMIESNVPPNLFGIGGSPGECVTIKAGASTIEPNKVDTDGYYLLNIDKGNQSFGGQNALVIGDLANPLVDPDNPQYQPKHLYNDVPLLVKSDQDGCIWIFIGSDSGFEGTTKFYIAEMILDLQPVL